MSTKKLSPGVSAFPLQNPRGWSIMKEAIALTPIRYLTDNLPEPLRPTKKGKASVIRCIGLFIVGSYSPNFQGVVSCVMQGI